MARWPTGIPEPAKIWWRHVTTWDSWAGLIARRFGHPIIVVVFVVMSLLLSTVILRIVFLAIRGDRCANRSAHPAAYDRSFATTHFRANRCTYTTTDRPTEYRVAIDS